jgi:Lambda phage tail tape-measure protein (Tape_meas_lam_C)
MARVAELVAEMSLSTARLQADVGRATGIMSRGMKKMSDDVGFLKNSLAGIVSVGSLVSLGKSVMQMGDDVSKASEKLGIGAEKLSAMAYAANLSDVSFESLQKGMKFLSQAITQAQVDGTDAAIAFKAMGIATTDAAGNVKPLDTLFSEVANKFSTMEDGAGKVSLAVALLGRAGMDLIPWLNKGAAGIATLEAEGRRLGATLSDKTAKSLETANDNLKSLWASVKGVAASLIALPLDKADALADSFGKSLADSAGEGFIPPGPNAVRFKAPPLPAKIAAPNVEAIKKAMEEAKKAAEEQRKANEALLKEGEKSWVDYADAIVKINEEEAKALSDITKKNFEDEAKETEAYQKIDLDGWAAYAEAVVAQNEEMAVAISEVMKSNLPENRFDEAMKLGDSATAVSLLNGGLAEQFRLIDEGREKVNAFQSLYAIAFRGMDGITADLANTTVDGLNRMTDAIVDFALTGKANFQNFANSVIANIMRIAVQQSIVQPIARGLMGAFGMNTETEVSGLPWLQGKASGGPVSGGAPYLVGERGPEMFVGSSGSIIPNGGGGNVKVEIVNQSGQEMKVSKASARFDPQEMVVTLWMDAANRNRFGLRSMLGGA